MLNINLIGRLTADVTTTTTANGTLINSFTVACNKSYGDKAHPLFVNVTFFNDIPTKMKLKKGASVSVVGELRQHDYTAKDGSKRTNYQVIGNSIEYVPSVQSNAVTPVTAIGRLTADISHNENNTAGSFTIAVDHGYGNKQTTSFVRAHCFNNVLDRIEKTGVVKGSPMLLVGDLDCRRFTRKDGTEGIETFINVLNFNLVSYGKKKDTENGENTASAPAPAENNSVPAPTPAPAGEDGLEEFENLLDEDLPF